MLHRRLVVNHVLRDSAVSNAMPQFYALLDDLRLSDGRRCTLRITGRG